MAETPGNGLSEFGESDLFDSAAMVYHTVLRLVLAIRYRRMLVAAVMMAVVLLGSLYYATAPRRYAAKASIVITQTGHDRLDTSIAGRDAQPQSLMPTFENILRSTKVLEGALKELKSADRADLTGASDDCSVAELQANLTVSTIRMTNIWTSAIGQSTRRSRPPSCGRSSNRILNFMDSIHKGTAGEISRILGKERKD